ncbi:MAG: tetratricopeptide repeat protein [Bacteroidales bacterium]
MHIILFLLVLFISQLLVAQDTDEIKRIDSLLEQAYITGSQDSSIANDILIEAEHRSDSIGYLSGKAEAKRLFGLLKFYNVDYTNAMELFVESRDLFNKAENEKGRAKAINNIAVLYNYQELNDKALELYNEILGIYKNINDSTGYAGTLNNIANIFSSRSEDAKALEYYRQVIDIYNKLGYNQRELSRSYNNIGGVFLKMNMPDSAYKYLVNSLEIRQEINDLQGVKNSYQTLGEYYESIGENDQALLFYNKSLDIAKNIAIPYEIESSAKDLYLLYAKTGEYRKAYESLSLYNEMKDISKKDDIIRLLTSIELEAKFEKEKELQRLLQEEKEFKQKQLINKQIRIRNTLIISLIVLSLIIYLIYRGYRIKQKHVGLLNMQKAEILEKNEELKTKQQEIIAQRNEIEKQKDKLELTNIALKSSNKKLTDNIQYAKTIQKITLPYHKNFANFSDKHYIMYKPRDIVSGDFYWYEKVGDNDVFALVDCTGHGVPGALMAMIGDGILKKVIIDKKTSDPAMVLSMVNEEIINSLKQQDEHFHNYDGMDMALLFINTKSRQIVYAGANISLYISDSSVIKKLESNKASLGGIKKKNTLVFDKKSIEYKPGTRIHMCTDGYFDQMSPEGKKFSRIRFEELLTNTINESFEGQNAIFENEWVNHKSNEDQIDDTTLINFQLF